MERIETDLLVFGWGKAGKSLARALGSSGRSVVMVEQSDLMYGGTCINIACVPTKALVHQAELRRDADSAAAWFTASVDKRDALTAKLRARNHAMLAEVDTVTVVAGHGVRRGNLNAKTEALWQVLRGEFNPIGQLPISLPKDQAAVEANASDVPGYAESFDYTYKNGAGDKYGFGFGLSYRR